MNNNFKLVLLLNARHPCIFDNVLNRSIRQHEINENKEMLVFVIILNELQFFQH